MAMTAPSGEQLVLGSGDGAAGAAAVSAEAASAWRNVPPEGVRAPLLLACDAQTAPW
jgi:hypothetical protein